MPVMTQIRRLRQEDYVEFKVRLRYISKIQANLDFRVKPYLKQTNQIKTNKPEKATRSGTLESLRSCGS